MNPKSCFFRKFNTISQNILWIAVKVMTAIEKTPLGRHFRKCLYARCVIFVHLWKPFKHFKHFNLDIIFLQELVRHYHTCLAHEDCSACVVVHHSWKRRKVPHGLYCCRRAAHSGSNNEHQQLPVAKVRLDGMSNDDGDDPYNFIISSLGRHQLYPLRQKKRIIICITGIICTVSTPTMVLQG
ncbi:hypothetical protein BC940DRAFT_86463 [Gongronella butleri]|nr:hypothetical protein BC940DRAFT_86463 [Gongronella butleri]